MRRERYHAGMQRLVLGALAAAVLAVSAGGCGNPIEPSGADLTGEWRGPVAVGMGEAGVLVLNLEDEGGRITGTGVGACRDLPHCAGFRSFTVTGLHDERRVRIFGTSVSGPTWTMEGTLSNCCTMSGLVAGPDIPQGTWELTRRR
jgi:hypothetical protein